MAAVIDDDAVSTICMLLELSLNNLKLRASVIEGKDLLPLTHNEGKSEKESTR